MWKNVFYFGHFLRFLTFFYFPNVFLFFKKTLAASRLTRSTFKITATK